MKDDFMCPGLDSNWRLTGQGPGSQKILSPLVILSMEKTMVTKVISELKSVSRLIILSESRPPLYYVTRRRACL